MQAVNDSLSLPPPPPQILAWEQKATTNSKNEDWELQDASPTQLEDYRSL